MVDVKIPNHIIDKLHRINNNIITNRMLMAEVEDWLQKHDINPSRLREETFSTLEQADYGELIPEKESIRRSLEQDVMDYPNMISKG